MTQSSKKGLIKALIVIGVIAGIFIGTYFLICFLWNTNTPFTVVEGTSMEPTLYEGDLLFVKKPKNLGEIQNGSHTARTGDILIYEHPHLEFLIVHRVIDKYYNDSEQIWYFNTQGDNDNLPDNSDIYGLNGGYLPENYIKGVMIGKIPWIGNIGIFLRDTGVGIFLIIIIIAYLLISSIFESKSEKTSKQSAGNGNIKEDNKENSEKE